MSAKLWWVIPVLLAAAAPSRGADPVVKSWALEPVRRPSPPAVREAAWVANPIDAFVLAKLEAAGLRPAPPADRRTLVRRVTFDLTGLPPTSPEIDAFLADRSATAYEKLIDRLLASPHYGEHWARHWLDVARFAETDGFEDDQQRLHAWTYRDYVIRAFNADKPYDVFVREQVAGDALKPVTADGIAAVGLLVAGPWDAVQRVTPSKLGRLRSREEQLEEMVGAVGQTFLGLTVQCARCHDHKFDPIPQTDYYRMKAVFEGVDHGLRPRAHGTRRMLSDADDAAWQKATAPLRARIDALEKSAADFDKQAGGAGKETDAAKELKAKAAAARKERDDARKELDAKHPVVLAFTGDREQPAPTVVYRRGDVTRPGDEVTPGGVSAVGTPKADLGLAADAPEAERRVRFAAWLTDPANPLTARVMVNRVWHYHFGTGIVDTPSDFGAAGGRPTHPELLDWLAAEFVARGWSVKALHRLILTSAAYRQSADPPAAAAAAAAKVDADARLLWRFPPRRIEGEAVRDAMLATSGALNRQAGGPSFKPYTVTQLNTYFYHLFDRDEPAFNRRSVYRMHLTTGRSPLLDALDCPSPGVATPRRRPTTTALQALALMNDTFVVREANRLATRLAAEKPDAADQVRLAFETVFGRPPAQPELDAAVEVRRRSGLGTVCWALFNASEFLYLR
ncbi:MAG TPA: DUF1549 and DUF1553 domain-containing protein [Urbifossiella sp.]|nr:DUF1549 and DUF1553 domain-containing protein [Urbifossiella sp.]